MKRIAVFCGSRPGARPAYAEAARTLAAELVRSGIGVVYGGGGIGLMGIVADEMLARGGEVIGVIPRQLMEREVGHRMVTDLRVVDSMHERKALMAELADAFIALPGGLGTFEEIFEVWTWAQLGVHRKPCGFLDVEGYYSGLMTFVDRGVEEGFIDPRIRRAAVFESDVAAMLDRFRHYEPPEVARWIARSET